MKACAVLLSLTALTFGCAKKADVSGRGAPAKAASAAPRSPASASALPAAASPGPSDADTVSQASPVYDAGAAAVAVGLEQVDGAKLRQQHIERLKQDRSAVTVLAIRPS